MERCSSMKSSTDNSRSLSSLKIEWDSFRRLFVAYDKGKEYLSSIFSRIDQQVDLWQKRRAIILDQQSSSASMDFLLSKTQRINELTIEAVQSNEKLNWIGHSHLRNIDSILAIQIFVVWIFWLSKLFALIQKYPQKHIRSPHRFPRVPSQLPSLWLQPIRFDHSLVHRFRQHLTARIIQSKHRCTLTAL